MAINRLLSVAPMMDCTDRHFRYIVRLLSQHVLLYSEMVTANAVIFGDREKLLGCDAVEHPLALQLGGSDPSLLARAAALGQDWGYDEVNLNVGCPSNRVQSGQFGVCLMKCPERVAECVVAMKDAVTVPVTVKCRIGVDDIDSYEHLCHFIEVVSAAGCREFSVHARKAWLHGLSPKQNRHVPPLRYEVVYQLKRDFPQLEVVLNGGVTSHDEIAEHLQVVDGVMIGREAYRNVYWLHDFDARYFDDHHDVLSRKNVILNYLSYVSREINSGVPLRLLTKHMLGLFHGVPGAKQCRHFLCEKSRQSHAWRDLESDIKKLINSM